MKSLDTNVLARIVLGDDEGQAREAALLLASGDCWCSHLVLMELAWVLGAHGFGRGAVADSLEDIAAMQGLHVDDPRAITRALGIFRKGPIGFADALILAHGEARGHGPLFTFDRALAEIEGAAAASKPAPRRRPPARSRPKGSR